uniref:PCNA-associated factor n=1 Tax=Geospiza parvula TaxID=87175 RepID=A0A8C3NK53_GEOPR
GFRAPLLSPAVPSSAVLVARAPRKALGSGSGSSSVRRPVGLNRVCVRPVPAWQRGISDFLQLPSKESRASDGDTPGTSGLEWVLGQGEVWKPREYFSVCSGVP